MLLYNLFPLLAGPFDTWEPHLQRAADMHFDWVYVNPIQRTGQSGSLYSIVDYFALNPLLVSSTSALEPEAQVRAMSKQAEALGLRLMIDLVVNHCATDSPLLKQHPAWFEWENGRVVNPSADENGHRVVWGDLAKFNHRHSSDKQGLEDYLFKIVEWLLSLGFHGFRCDAAYQLPTDVWRRLIERTRKKHPGVMFCAETLGCTADETKATSNAGFDYIFNSSKWWDFHSHWLMAQYNLLRDTVPSIAFAESHDTERMMTEAHGNVAALKQRYLFSTFFSAGVMMPMGYEFGFRKKPHVVHTRPTDWEQPSADITAFIRGCNDFKRSNRIFLEEAPTSVLPYDNGNILVMWKGSKTREEALLVLNKDPNAYQHFWVDRLGRFVQAGGALQDVSPEDRQPFVHEPYDWGLRPGEGRVFVTRR